MTNKRKPHKSRALIRKPREHASVTRYTIGNGTPEAIGSVKMLSYNIGTCPAATADNPHDIGAKPNDCDRCYIVTS